MKILLTGANGFLGKYISIVIKEYQPTFLSRNEEKGISCDLSVSKPDFNNKEFELVIHNAGKAHSNPKTSAEIDSFYKVNLEGTKNLCMSLEKINKLPTRFVFISSVAVYGLETGENITEDSPLLGNSAYALSKIQAEKYLETWCTKHKILLTILRLPLIVGVNAPGNFGMMLNSIKKGYYFRIGSGSAKRSMVLASDVANIILKASEKGGTFNLTDGLHPSFAELDNYISFTFDKKVKVLPLEFAKMLAKVGDFIPAFPFNSNKLVKMKSSLTFSSELAIKKINWNPNPVIGNIF
jgi:nucleoside-diphosphate-sugar epimerase